MQRPVFAGDWPVYKGNLYLTGNNDEIVIKNNHIKWIFEGKTPVYNPVVSDGIVYIIDKQAIIYALDEGSGEVLWQQSLVEISKRFVGTARSAGKVKYPVIKGKFLIVTDSTMIYAFDKRTGGVVWSRTAMYDEKNLQNYNTVRIDGIYSDPVIHENSILYGTRNVFMARSLTNGALLWNRLDIESYSGFPIFYDSLIFTQSSDYGEKAYYLYCLDLNTGETKWKTRLSMPFKIFSPVVYKGKVYIPVSDRLIALSLDTGKILWEKKYPEIITSEPSFTDREITFTTGNHQLVSVSPEDGSILSSFSYDQPSSPRFVIIRDQLCVARNYKKKEGEHNITYASLEAFTRSDKHTSEWKFLPPYPGGVSQPSAENGILYLPAGNYLYAIGGEHKTSIIHDPNGDHLEYIDQRGDHRQIDYNHPLENHTTSDNDRETPKQNQNGENTRNASVTIKTDQDFKQGEVEVITRENGEITSRETFAIKNGENSIPVPTGEGKESELITSIPGYAPVNQVIETGDKPVTLKPEKLKAGESFSLDTIEFELNSSRLKKEALPLLEHLLKIMNENSSMSIEIRGHTDSTGKADYNQILSEKRAESVAEYLIKHGISPERLKTRGYGQTKPVADNKTESGRKQNRRVEFYLITR